MNQHACDPSIHEGMKSSAWSFAISTVRLTDHERHETYQNLEGDIRWLRLCRACSSTLAIRVNDVAGRSAV